MGSLTLVGDTFYGLTYEGGEYNAGTIISFSFSTSTSTPTPTMTPAPTLSSSSTKSSKSSLKSLTSNVITSTSAPGCSSLKPVGIPDLFQIDVTSNTAKLFFTPIDTNNFYISFSENPYAQGYGDEANLLKEGVQNYTVYHLKANTTYYFKVRGQNGCMPGDWSNIMKVKTRNKGLTKPISFYSYSNGNAYFTFPDISQIINDTTPIFFRDKNINQQNQDKKSSSVNSRLNSKPTPKSLKKSSTKQKSFNYCFLWWCW